ncbi:MAG: type I-E CRISPR-associated protein Cas7/Cse4/CasC [Dermabacter sp.]|nr:type I-E CRISPR-associated protein Cas7/Cse4/CasC [Dermabacter sp.]
MTLVLDIHALQTLPPSNINRDDTGAPKSAIFGGVPRQRVSSQSWKRAIRQDFEDTLGAEAVGYRTKHVADLIEKEIIALTEANGEAWEAERAQAATKNLFSVAGIKLTDVPAKEDTPAHAVTGYLLFLSPRQIANAARALVESDGAKPSKKEARALLDQEHSIDIAMFGRMVADAPDYNVDASVQVAHAIGIHESEPEFDYYTAVDDVVEDREETGAGMIGTMQMMSSTLYRFATVNLDALEANLGDHHATVEAALAFVRSFITSLPTGKQNSYAHNTVPELVYVAVRDTRSLSLVTAFEEPVRASDGASRRLEGATRLAKEATALENDYGFTPKAAFVIGLGDVKEPFAEIATATTFPALESSLRTVLEAGEDS